MTAPSGRALITGITGQDGSFLAELLLEHGYEVIGMARGGPDAALGLSEHLRDRITIIGGDLRDAASLTQAVAGASADEIYHLAAPTFVPDSWREPRQTIEAIAGATATVLQAVIATHAPTRVFVASSGEMFGDADASPQREDTACRPRNPYAAAKLLAHQLAGQLRDHAGVHVCSGILYNHESERRPKRFVSRKITRAAAEIKLGVRSELSLGDLSAVRDWSFAGDVMHGAWLALQHETPNDYIFASGIPHTVDDLLQAAFAHVGLDPGEYVRIDTTLTRGPEHTAPVGDPTRAHHDLGWTPACNFQQLIARMVDADLRALANSPDAQV
ncbi:MAG TPA: GDP-mannose 4,6-dehydratase [Solirubrobacteraceae bacterium]|nr:GDP-mannose 4,6-dehydratase [Solirubrobacteraceae bacterium]